MDPTTMTQQQILIFGILINAGIGLVIGLVPLILGFVKGNIRYGLFGFFASIIGGAILGILLSVPAAVIFSVMIFRKAKQPAEVIVVNPEPIDVSLNDGRNN